MLPIYFHFIFVHLRQKARLRLEQRPKFLSTLGPNPTRKARLDLPLCLRLWWWEMETWPTKKWGIAEKS